MSAMTSHELAAKLLRMPDVPVLVHVGERSWPDDLEIEPDDVTLLSAGDGTPTHVEVWPV